MEHFFQNIQGWFNCEELYKEQVEKVQGHARFVEVGAWRGKSAAFMAVEIINSGKDIDFHVVDSFQGSKEHQDEAVIKEGTLQDEFFANLAPIKDYLFVWAMPSLQAVDNFADQSVDFVYIDASHEYEDVKDDIQAWLPKVKPGGLLAGDDYYIYPGVKKAVDELLPNAAKKGIYWMWTV